MSSMKIDKQVFSFPAELTTYQVRGVWEAFQNRYGTRVREKSKSRLMRIFGGVLERRGYTTKQRFLTHVTTTIGRTVFAPFEVGRPSDRFPFWKQVLICVHEHRHRIDRVGLKYLWSKNYRALVEPPAYGVSTILWELATERRTSISLARIKDVASYDPQLYGVSKVDITYGVSKNILAAKQIRDQGTTSDPYLNDAIALVADGLAMGARWTHRPGAHQVVQPMAAMR